MINERLFQHYGIDTQKDLRIPQRCARPFDTVLIDKQGSCYACECQAWLPQSIGNLQIKPLAEILADPMRAHLQQSVSDGTYRYCNARQCSYIKGDDVREVVEQRIRYVRLAIDESCNLKCPSCRPAMTFHKSGSIYDRGIRLADRVNQWLETYEHPVMVHIGSDGDPFASHVYRHFMSNTPERPGNTYSLLTNGLMLKDFHKNIPHITRNLHTLGISIDGATQPTYEKLRLGGKWDKVLEALDCARSLKRDNGFELQLHMVVQQDNWQEMELMDELAHEYEADWVYFNPIEDWNTGMDMSRQTFKQEDEFKHMVERLSHSRLAWVNLPNFVSQYPKVKPT